MVWKIPSDLTGPNRESWHTPSSETAMCQPAASNCACLLEDTLQMLPEGVNKVRMRSDAAGFQTKLLKYCEEGRNEHPLSTLFLSLHCPCVTLSSPPNCSLVFLGGGLWFTVVLEILVI